MGIGGFSTFTTESVSSIARLPYAIRGVFSLTSGVENGPELVGLYYLNLVSFCLQDGGKLSGTSLVLLFFLIMPFKTISRL